MEWIPIIISIILYVSTLLFALFAVGVVFVFIMSDKIEEMIKIHNIRKK